MRGLIEALSVPTCLFLILGTLAVVGVSPASAAVPAPTITSFASSPAALPDSGGSVTLSATVTGATSCVISSSSAITGLPQTQSCTSGTLSLVVSIPADTTTRARTYVFTVVATGAEARKATTRMTVADQPPPVIGLFTATPAPLPQAGGPVELSAEVIGATSCVFSSAPVLTGLPQTVPCTGGTGSVSVTVPANTTTKAKTYKLSLIALGSKTVKATSAVSQASEWSCTSNEPINDMKQAPPGYTGSTYYVTWENSVCRFASDPTNFVGRNDPTGMGGLTQEVDQDMWSPICANSTGGIVALNDPTCVTRETQEIQANSAQDWQVTVNAPTDPTGAVTTFPNAWAHGYGGVLDNYTSLTSSVSVTMPNASGVVGHAMQDDYLSQPGDTGGDYEVMIQYDRVNDGSCPTTASINGTSWNWGVTATDVMIDGTPWFLCDAQTTNDRGTKGACPTTGSLCGAVVWKPAPVGCSGTACTDSNAMDDTCNGGAQASPCSATFDLKAMFQWLETHDPPGESYPYVEVGSSVEAIDSGFEVSSTGRVAQTFASSGFTVDATGAPST